MMIDVEEILQDLELKRAAALPHEEQPSIDLEAALDGLDERGLELTLIDAAADDHLPAATRVGRVVADALGTLALARGDAEPLDGDARALVREVTEGVLRRLREAAGGGRAEVSGHDLSVVVEAQLIAAGRLEVAKALVMRRATTAPGRSAEGAPRLIRRSGQVVSWREGKIEAAVRKAFLSLGSDPAPAPSIAVRVTERARSLGTAYVPIETVQDIVQEELVLAGHMRVAERYILYRAERAMLRAAERREARAPAEPARSLSSRTTGGSRSGTARTCACAFASPPSGSTSRWTSSASRRSCAGRSTRARVGPTSPGSSS
jgi:ribonucleoside-diphosphate reductase alpha chain